jgi:hypothetical protein
MLEDPLSFAPAPPLCAGPVAKRLLEAGGAITARQLPGVTLIIVAPIGAKCKPKLQNLTLNWDYQHLLLPQHQALVALPPLNHGVDKRHE